MGKGLQHPSGRVIALGRLLLATLFLVAILIDASQPAREPEATYTLLGGYLLFAILIVAATWKDWWLDAKLAGPAHAVDIVLFTALVFLTQGFTSPFFTFFMFILLSAAIRWGWNITAASAILLTLLFLTIGLATVTPDQPFELQRFTVRTGHLVILSLILIWFGANQWHAGIALPDEDLFDRPELDESPLETGLRAAMTALRATSGTLLWRESGRGDFVGLAIRKGEATMARLPASPIADTGPAAPFLYDVRKGRGLARDADRNLVRLAPSEAIAGKAAKTLELTEGLAIPIRTESGEGALFLEQVRNLSTDHLDLGRQVALDIAVHVQRHALLKTAEDSAESRSRLTMARDLHDSVVQFLAGAAFRLEAMKRSTGSGRDIEPQLDELKGLMLQEQRELRAFIKALRSGPLVELRELVAELKSLAEHLSRQWDVSCTFTARTAEMMIPTRVRLDAHQLMREAVANAVRHAQAKSVEVELDTDPDSVRLTVVNDGAEIRTRDGRIEMPASLGERVAQAGGSIDMARGMGVTKLSISLPIGEGGGA